MVETEPTSPILCHMEVIQPILCCPTDKSRLALLPLPTLLDRLAPSERARVPKDAVGAFVSDRGRAYPIVGRIISFLDQDVLQLADARAPLGGAADPSAERVKGSVKDWYDRFGWRKSEEGVYHDTALFSQRELSGHGFYEMSSHLNLLDRLQGGDFVLDAASGAVAHSHNLSYSWYHRYRICVDLSITALKEAEQKLGDTGFYCLADICRLPFQNDAVDGIVSGYTIQHIPESQQVQAVTELFRVLRPGAHLCVLTDVEVTRWHHALLLGYRIARKIAKLSGIAAPFDAVHAAGVASPPHQLYFVPHDWKWWQAVGEQLSNSCSVECLRSLSKNEYERIFGPSTRAARFIRALETCFPRLMARASAYCLVDIPKPMVIRDP